MASISIKVYFHEHIVYGKLPHIKYQFIALVFQFVPSVSAVRLLQGTRHGRMIQSASEALAGGLETNCQYVHISCKIQLKI